MPDRWDSGTTVVLQEVWDGKLWSARPMTVVEDREDRLALWCPSGTNWKTATTPPWRRRAATRAERFVALLTGRDWELRDFSWGVSNLILVRPGDWHAVWVGWNEKGESMGWYVNFQRPYVRTARGIQTMDLMLDLVVAPDRSWIWKDEDELEALVRPGLIAEDEARCIHDEAQSMVVRIEHNEAPFCEPWHEWRPNPVWSTPLLEAGWDHVEEGE